MAEPGPIHVRRLRQPIGQVEESPFLLLLGVETRLNQVDEHAVRAGFLALCQVLHRSGNPLWETEFGATLNAMPIAISRL